MQCHTYCWKPMYSLKGDTAVGALLSSVYRTYDGMSAYSSPSIIKQGTCAEWLHTLLSNTCPAPARSGCFVWLTLKSLPGMFFAMISLSSFQGVNNTTYEPRTRYFLYQADRTFNTGPATPKRPGCWERGRVPSPKCNGRRYPTRAA